MAFEIKNTGLLLEIGGASFTVHPDNADFMEKLEAFYEEAQKKHAALSTSTDKLSVKVRDMCDFCVQSIDDLLGEGSCKTIFGDTAVGMMDLLGVIVYIKTETNRFLAESTKKVQMMNSNREQRRKAQKKK